MEKTVNVSMNLEIVKKLSDLQYEIFIKGGEVVDGMITFTHDHTEIVNPFIDESSSYSVNPIEYYGEAFLKSDWKKFLE